MNIPQKIFVAVDAVVFGYSNKKLQILLVERKSEANQDKWALPGGFVKDEESLHEAVQRELKEETAIEANYLEQLYTFGAPKRDPRGRVISIAYLALLDPTKLNIKADTDVSDVKWFPVNGLPTLSFDHSEIIETGLERLRNKINYQPIGFELLSDKFPFSDIENLYQTIIEKPIDRRNFRKKLLSFGFIEETNEFHKPASGRPAKLYKINVEKYKQLVESGFNFEIKFA